MPPRIDSEQNPSCRQGTDSLNRGESAVATIWLLFYVLAVGVAIATFLAQDVASQSACWTIWAVKSPSVGDRGYERPLADGISIGRPLC